MANVVPFQQPAQPEALQNLDAEALLIGALMIEASLIADASTAVAPEDFHEPIHGRAFAAIIAEHAAGRRINPVLLKPYFEGDAALEELGGLAYFARLTGNADGLLAAPELAQQIRELAIRRRLRDSLALAGQAVVDLASPLADAMARTAECLADTPEVKGATFELLDLAELEQMPAPRWLVHEIVADNGLTVIYGDPGAGKSFVALDMALRIALGMDWHGTRARKTGVLYIAGEGARGIGKRVAGWRMNHGLHRLDAPFLLLPVAVHLLDPAERAKLIRTIDEAKRRAGFDIGLTVVDTVSRAMPGADENSQDTMSAFVAACDSIKAHTGGALIGIHHSGKDKDRGMRGSSVLLGGVDAAVKLTKDNGLVTLLVEKQKDAEDGQTLHMRLEKLEWNTGSADHIGEDISTLIPIRADAAESENGAPSYPQIVSAFAMMAEAWTAGKPLSSKTQTRRDGRFAPAIFASRIGGQASEWDSLISTWLAKGIVTFELVDTHSKISGLRVNDPIT